MSEKGLLKQIGPWALLWVLATITLFYITIDLNNIDVNNKLRRLLKLRP